MNRKSANEIFDIVDEQDKVIGQASRQEVHSNPSLIHRVVHILVFNPQGELFLQKRSPHKDTHPGKWDTSVGGHVDAGESYDQAARREMVEELGIQGAQLESLYSYIHRDVHETEFVSSYRCCWDGPININPEEIEAGRFWSLKEIKNSDEHLFTPNFLEELERFQKLQLD